MRSKSHVRVIVLAVGAVVAFSVLAPALATSTTPVYAQSTVATQVFAPEPSIAVDRSVTPNRVYVTSNPHSIFECCTFMRPLVGPGIQPTRIWRSFDGGQTFSGPIAGGGGGGGSDVAVDGVGTVFVVEAYDRFNRDSLPVSGSGDGGQSFGCCITMNLGYNPFFACYERPFIAAEGNGHIVVIAQCQGQLDAFVMRAGEWNIVRGPFTIATDVLWAGKPAFHPINGNLVYVPYVASNRQVRSARSTDGGMSWSSWLVIAQCCDYTFPAAAVDESGVVYLVRARADTAAEFGLFVKVTVLASYDTGFNWVGPYFVSDLARSSLFPAITAGKPGQVAISYYVANNPGGLNISPDLGSAVTSWDVEVAHSFNANNPAAMTFSRSVAAPAVHTGSICTIYYRYCHNQEPFTGAPSLPIPLDGRVGNFLMMDSDSLGNVLIPYPKDTALYVGPDLDYRYRQDLTVARQIDGPRIR